MAWYLVKHRDNFSYVYYPRTRLVKYWHPQILPMALAITGLHRGYRNCGFSLADGYKKTQNCISLPCLLLPIASFRTMRFKKPSHKLNGCCVSVSMQPATHPKKLETADRRTAADTSIW